MSIRVETSNPWRIWDPPMFPRPSPTTSTHTILPLKCLNCSQKFIGSLENNQILADKIHPNVYQTILSTINQHLKFPYILYI